MILGLGGLRGGRCVGLDTLASARHGEIRMASELWWSGVRRVAQRLVKVRQLSWKLDEANVKDRETLEIYAENKWSNLTWLACYLLGKNGRDN